MKILEGLVVTQVGEDYFAVPTGAATEKLHGLVRLNETGAEIVKGLIEGMEAQEIADRLMRDYKGADRETSLKAVQSVVDSLSAAGLMTN